MKNNYLKDKFPEIFAQIDVERTLQEYPELDILKLRPCTHKKIFWKCKKCGSSYVSSVSHRTCNNPTGCPYCANKKVLPGYNDLETFCKNNPEYQYILKSWDYSKNKIKPNEITPYSNKIVYFTCPNNHSYKQRLSDKISKKYKCPYCNNKQVLSGYNDLETYIKNHPEYRYILDEWDYNKNLIKPNEIASKSNKSAWFTCKNGHSYKQRISNKIFLMSGCPYCNHKKSVPELTIYQSIREYIDPQVISGIKINNYEIDVYSPKYNLCIEYDGIYWHTLEKAKIRENKKNISILADCHKYKLVRIKEIDNLTDINNFKKILPSGIIVYYISKKYDKKYFQILSKIIEDLFSITIDYKEIQKIYANIKINNQKTNKDLNN